MKIGDSTFEAWAAGLFDAEGCISARSRRQIHVASLSLEVIVAMTEQAPLEALCARWGGSVIVNQRPRYRRVWRWVVRGDRAQGFLSDVLPFLSVKADAGRLALQFLHEAPGRGRALTPSARSRRAGLITAIQASVRDHPDPVVLLQGDALAAWAAGFFDGEGTVHAHRELRSGKWPSHKVAVQLANTALRPLQAFQRQWGGSIIDRPPRSPGERPQWFWRVSMRTAEPFLLAVIPHLVTKRDAALLALRIASSSGTHGKKVASEVFAFRDDAVEQIRDLNRANRGKVA